MICEMLGVGVIPRYLPTYLPTLGKVSKVVCGVRVNGADTKLPAGRTS